MLDGPTVTGGFSYYALKSERRILNRNFEFARVYRLGKSYVTPLVVVYVARKKRGGLRMGIAAGKKVGGAVERNRARRVVKAALSEIVATPTGSFDVIFVCRSKAPTVSSKEMKRVLEQTLMLAGVIEQ